MSYIPGSTWLALFDGHSFPFLTQNLKPLFVKRESLYVAAI